MLSDFLKAPSRYILDRGSLARDLSFHLGRITGLARPATDWQQLLHALADFHNNFLEATQIESEIIAALELFEQEQPRRVLEIGTARGGNFYLLSRAAAEDATLVSLDLPGGPFGGGYSTWKLPIYRRLVRPGQRPVFLRANSHDVSSVEIVRRHLNQQPLDLAFIDGDHTYQGVKRDWELYSPLVRAGGLIAFHDIVENPGWGVNRLWNEVKTSGVQYWEFVADPKQGWAGIGIVRKAV